MTGSAHVTKGGSRGMMSFARLESPYPQVSKAKFRDITSWRGKSCKVCKTFLCKLALPIHHVWLT